MTAPWFGSAVDSGVYAPGPPTMESVVGTMYASKSYNGSVVSSWPGSGATYPTHITVPLVTVKVALTSSSPYISSGDQAKLATFFASMPTTGTPIATINQEGEANRFGYTSAQVAGSHNTAYNIFKVNAPANALYCQNFQTYSAKSMTAANFKAKVCCAANGQQDLPLYMWDWYPYSSTTTAVNSINTGVGYIQSLVTSPLQGCAECNYTTGSGITSTVETQTQWFTNAWNYAVSNNFFSLIAYFYNPHGCNWPPDGGTAVETELTTINAASRAYSGGGGGGTSSVTLSDKAASRDSLRVTTPATPYTFITDNQASGPDTYLSTVDFSTGTTGQLLVGVNAANGTVTGITDSQSNVYTLLSQSGSLYVFQALNPRALTAGVDQITTFLAASGGAALGTPYTIVAGVQTVSSGTTFQQTVTASTATGDAIVVSATNNDTTITSVTDSQGNTYTAVESQTGNTQKTYQFVALNTTALVSGTDWIKITYGTIAVSSQVGFIARGCSGVATSSATDAAGSATTFGTSTAPAITGTSAIAQASEWISAVIADANGSGAPSAWAGGFTQVAQQHGTGEPWLTVAEQVTTSVITPAASATITSGVWAMCQVALKAASTGSTTTGGINVVGVYDPVGAQAVAVTGSGTGLSGSVATGALSQPDQHIIAFGWENAGGTPSWSTGTELTESQGHQTGYLSASYQSVTSTASVTMTSSWPLSTNWNMIVLALTEAVQEVAAAAESFIAGPSPFLNDVAGSADGLAISTLDIPAAFSQVAGARDGLKVAQIQKHISPWVLPAVAAGTTTSIVVNPVDLAVSNAAAGHLFQLYSRSFTAPFVANTTQNFASASSFTVPVTTATSSGNLLIAVTTTSASIVPNTPTDSKGTQYYLVAQQTANGMPCWVYQAVSGKALTTSDTISVTLSGGSSAVNILAISTPGHSAADPVSGLGASGTGAAASVALPTSGNVIPTLASFTELAVCFAHVSTNTPTWAAGITPLATASGNSAGFLTAGYIYPASQWGIAPSATFTGSVAWSIIATVHQPNVQIGLNFSGQFYTISSIVGNTVNFTPAAGSATGLGSLALQSWFVWE